MFNFINSFDEIIYKMLSQYSPENTVLFHLSRVIAVWLVYLVPVSLISIWFYGPREKVVALRVFLAGLFGWLAVNNVIAHFFFRPRPSVQAAQELLFHRPDKAFPSDHATLGFALVAGFWLAGYKKVALFFLLITLLFSIARVTTGLHYASDIVGGLGVGVAVAWLAYWQRKNVDKFIVQPVIKIAKIVRLA